MANLAPLLVAAVVQHSRAAFVRKTHHADRVQENFLHTLLQTHQHTEFGRDHGFADIQTLDQFRERIPICTYHDFEPYTTRMSLGEPNVLTRDPLVYMNISSGSTGQKKWIPVTRRSRQVLSRSSRAAIGFAVDAARREKRPIGQMLLPLSVNPTGYTPSGIAYAPVSTSDLRLMDVLSRQMFTFPFKTFQVSDTPARYYLCLLFALRNVNLRIIAATFPVLVLQLCEFLNKYAESLIHDLETGEIAAWLPLDPALRAFFQRNWSAFPQRAAQLRHSFRVHGRLTPQHAWPHLSFLITARGGTSNFYFERFPDYFGNLPIFGGVYSCAEGVMGVHRDFNTDSAILAIESGFFEFIPEDQWDHEHPQTLLPWEVKPGHRYRIVMTNYSGFCRYEVGDVVEIDGFCGRAPLIIFRHRRGGVMSSSTEKTTEFHAIRVMQILQQEFHLALENFCMTLSDDGIPPHYLVNIELTPGSTLDNPEYFLQRFDDVLQENQPFYAIKRRDQIPLPRLKILQQGSFATLRQRMIQRGVPESQLKFAHVSEDRTYLEGLIVQQEIRLVGDRT